MSSLYTIGQMNEVADALEADGYTPDEVKALISALPNVKTVEKMEKYTIRRGDPLSVIARKFSVSIDDLKEVNDLRSAHKIRSGQTLFIPD